MIMNVQTPRVGRIVLDVSALPAKANHRASRPQELSRILEDFENELYKIERQAAERMLDYFRHELSKFCLGRHNVTVWAAMGGCGLCVNGAPIHGMFGTGWASSDRPVVAKLRAIEAALEYRFAYFMVGKALN